METIVAGIVIIAIVVAVSYWPFGRKEHKRYYFAANEVVFQITHPATTTPAEIVTAMQSFLKSQGNVSQQGNFSQQVQVGVGNISPGNSNWRNRLKPPTLENSRIITFPSLDGETFSLVTISLAPFSLIPIRLGGHRKKDLRPKDVIRVLNGAYAELPNGSLVIGEGISLQSISPNWFAKNLHHGGPTGGPGSWPLDVPALQQPGTGTSSQISEREFRLAGPMESLKPHKDRIPNGEVHVAILDTIPTKNLEQAAQGLINSSADPLIQYLFNSLDIHPYSNPAELTGLNGYTSPPYHYEMPDHGTFIAGIIHTIAPKATLHLYEVLNSFGLGTLTSMAQGLIDAVNDHKSRGNFPLMVHCSFMLDLVTQNGVSNLNQELNLTDPKISGSLTKSTLGVLTWVTSLKNVVVVAAAGNDAGQGVRPYASYPAAFRGVVGVGALPKEYPTSTYPSGQYYIPASYSNFSYDPQNKLPGDGFMTFGGELDMPRPINGVPTSTKGVLGVYVGKLVKNSANANVNNLQLSPSSIGWARWAGTSFAAPIITGLLAAQPGDASISTIPPAPAVQPFTAEGENVIIVNQG